MLEPEPNQLQLISDIKTGLASIRRLLLETPGKFSLVTAASALDHVSFGLMALDASLRNSSPELSPQLQQELLELQSLSARVHALYRQAAAFYGGLAAESIKNGSWDSASYSQEGDWAKPASQHGQRIAAEG